MSKKFEVTLDDEDADLFAAFQRIFSSMKVVSGEEPAAAESTGRRSRRSAEPVEAPAEPEVPQTTRRRRAGADAASSTTEPASDAGASGGRRARHSAEPAPAPAAEEPRRRRRTEEAPKDDRISDADLTKAASQAGEVISPKVVMQILKEDYGVETVNDIPQDKRRAFLDTLKFEMEG